MRNPPDPRVVFAFMAVMSTYGVVVRQSLVIMGILLFVSVAVAVFFRVQFRKIFGRIKRLLPLIFFVAIAQVVFSQAGIIGGVQLGLLVLFRLSLFLTCAAMLTLYPVRGLIQGMAQCKMPYEIAYMVSVGIRFIPQLSQEMKDSLVALQLRGIVITELKLRTRLKLYSYLLLPVLVSCLQNAKELAMSMEMRAFRAYETRTSFYVLKFSKKDKAMLVCIALMAVAVGLAMLSFRA